MRLWKWGIYLEISKIPMIALITLIPIIVIIIRWYLLINLLYEFP